jgi:glycopeptide antibiotics resistance protein
MNLISTLFLPAIPVSLGASALYVLFYAMIKKSLPSIGSIALAAAFSAYIFFVLSATLIFRSTHFFNQIELDPIASYRRAANAPTHLAILEIRDIILNIAMFVPLGIFLPLTRPRLGKFYIVPPIALLASLTIETTQLVTNRGVFSIEDILHNTLGAALGLALCLTASKIFKKP